MKRTEIKKLLESANAGDQVCVKAWVRTKRGSKNVNFIALNDGSTIQNLQLVAELDVIDDSILQRIHTGACISAEGEIAESQGSGQRIELKATSIDPPRLSAL